MQQSHLSVVSPSPEVVIKAHEVHQAVLALNKEATGVVFRMGGRLMQIHENQYWQVLGYESFDAYLADPHVSKGRSNAYRMMRLFRRYILDVGLENRLGEFQDIDVQKLEIIASVITKDNWEEWIHEARELDRFALRDKVRAVRKSKTRKAPEETGPEPPALLKSFAAENAQLAPLHGEVIEKIVLTPHGLILETDGNQHVRVWAAGDEIRIDVHARLEEETAPPAQAMTPLEPDDQGSPDMLEPSPEETDSAGNGY